MQHYLIAKYVDDIRRNEPVNVGVIVFDGGEVAARFEGEDDRGRLDRRRIRKLVTGRDAYTAWVRYWRRVLEETSDPEALLAAGSRDFYVEAGGSILLDHEQRRAADAASELYARLVKPEDPPAPMTLQEKSQRALRRIGVDLESESHFRADVPVELAFSGQRFEGSFSYAVRNGAWHFLQEISLDSQRPRRSRKEANNCAFLMEHALLDDGGRLALFDSTDIDEVTEPMLGLVAAIVPVVDVDDTDGAAASLASALHLEMPTAGA